MACQKLKGDINKSYKSTSFVSSRPFPLISFSCKSNLVKRSLYEEEYSKAKTKKNSNSFVAFGGYRDETAFWVFPESRTT
jgi:hypothetical protein